ncbi:hypothetical protein PFISCL1PPCAC_3667, partial [Pristionchus fissidentatus]
RHFRFAQFILTLKPRSLKIDKESEFPYEMFTTEFLNRFSTGPLNHDIKMLVEQEEGPAISNRMFPTRDILPILCRFSIFHLVPFTLETSWLIEAIMMRVRLTDGKGFWYFSLTSALRTI